MGTTYYNGSLGFVDGSSNVHVLYPKTRTGNVYDSTGTSLDTIISNINTAISGKADSGHNHDDTYLQLSGGTMTGTIVTPKNDNMGIEPAVNNYGQLGSSSKYFYRAYIKNIYTADTSISSTDDRVVNGRSVYSYISSLHDICKFSSSTTQAIPNNSWTELTGRTLTAGSWLINATVRYATAPTNVELSVSASSADWHPINNDYEFITSQVFPANGSINKTVRVTGLLQLTSSTKIYLNTSQVNGNSASINLNNWTLSAVRLRE